MASMQRHTFRRPPRACSWVKQIERLCKALWLSPTISFTIRTSRMGSSLAVATAVSLSISFTIHQGGWGLLRLLVFLLLASSVPAVAADVDYLRDVKPLLKERCFACHGTLKQQSGLRLDSVELMRKGSDNGAVVVPGDADSTLIERISAADEAVRMPPEGEPLSASQIARIKAWIVQGAQSPPDEKPETDPREHWAFRTPLRPVVPQVANAAWARSPIDSCISAAHQAQDLSPQPSAGKRTWLRRVSLDLIGLPPTLAEQKAFLADETRD